MGENVPSCRAMVQVSAEANVWQEVVGSSEAVFPATCKMSQVLRQLRAAQRFLRQTVGRVIETLLGQSSMIATEVAHDILAS